MAEAAPTSGREFVEPEGIESIVNEFLYLKNEEAKVKSRMDELKPQIVAHLEEHFEPDSDGHRLWELDEPVQGFKKIQHQCRVSRSVDMDAALTIFGENDIDDCIVMVPTVDEEAVMQHVYEGDLVGEQVDAIFVKKITYAVAPKRR